MHKTKIYLKHPPPKKKNKCDPFIALMRKTNVITCIYITKIGLIYYKNEKK